MKNSPQQDAFDSEVQDAMDNLDVVRVAVGAVHDDETSAAFRELTHFLQDLSERDDLFRANDDDPTANAILQLASSVGDIGPAIKELASNVDHSTPLADLAQAVDDMGQSITKATNE